MPYIEVHVDAEDVLPDLTDKQLREELQSRATKRGEPTPDFETVEQTALRQALEERDWSKVEELATLMGAFWFRGPKQQSTPRFV